MTEKITNYDAVDKLTDNLIRHLETIKMNENAISQYRQLKNMSAESKLVFICQHLKPERHCLDSFINSGMLKYGHKPDDFKLEDVTKVKRFLQALIECT